ncbi:MAG: hypothetical protein ABIH41_01595 [Nanoarchaeota archaeon]
MADPGVSAVSDFSSRYDTLERYVQGVPSVRDELARLDPTDPVDMRRYGALRNEYADASRVLRVLSDDIGDVSLRPFASELSSLRRDFDESPSGRYRLVEAGLDAVASALDDACVDGTLADRLGLYENIARQHGWQEYLGRIADLSARVRADESPERVYDPGSVRIAPRSRSPSQEYAVSREHRLDDILRYCDAGGVVGETKLKVLGAYALVQRMHTLFQGASSSGKSSLLRRLVGLLDDDKVVGLDAMSNTALHRAAGYLDGKVLCISEWQKAMHNPFLADVIKSITEGQDMPRLVTEPDLTVRLYHLPSNVTVFSSLDPNDEAALPANLRERLPALKRRMLRLRTDESDEQTRHVLEDRAASRMVGSPAQVSDPSVAALRSHVRSASSIRRAVCDPFAQYMLDVFPSSSPIVRGYAEKYCGLVDASVKFNFPERVAAKGGQPVLFAALEDYFIVHSLFYDDFLWSIEDMDGSAKVLMDVEHLSSSKVDWQGAFDAGLDVMRSRHPDVARRWVEAQSQEGEVLAYDASSRRRVPVASVAPDFL